MLTSTRKRVWRLRIFQTARYELLVKECQAAISVVSNGSIAGTVTRGGCTEIYSNWKHWFCLFPQHGVGPKHLRNIELQEWQRRLVDRYPEEFIRGLVHSDGCRCVNRVKQRRYEYVRYFFSNHSEDILKMFTATCALIGVECRRNNRWQLSVAKRDSVAILESFIGPKS